MNRAIIIYAVIFLALSVDIMAQTTSHPRLVVTNDNRTSLLSKIDQEGWANLSLNNLLASIDPMVTRHQTDPEWIVSRMSMYWKEGERYTQCYIKKQNWDYGEGNAPLPTVRLPGMRTWNNYINVPLEERLAYSESGDMLGIDRSSDDKTPVLVPYKQSGHMVRQNNNEILVLAEKASFAYWLTQDQKYAKFASDILWTWLLGTYYMEPPLDPEQSTGGPGGYEPGGIMGYYDYEVIHDDGQIPAAVAYDFLHDYMQQSPHPHLAKLELSVKDLAGVVFKRFIDIGLIRGFGKGNWNVNRYKNIMNSILVLEPNDFYEDGKGREYYIPYYTEIASDYHLPLPQIMDNYDKVTGLWPESPGYASGMVSSVLNMGMKLYGAGVNTMDQYPMIEKAALANLDWLDARGNLVVFGDMRGGPLPYGVFEHLLTYFTWKGDTEKIESMASVLLKALESGQHSRDQLDWQSLCLYQPLPEAKAELPYKKAVYSRFHRHLIMKNGNDDKNGLMFTVYGGKKGGHLSHNGLSMQFYAQGYAVAPDAQAYESYWSDDSKYHRGISGSNTIVPGYTRGEITVNAMEPWVDSAALSTDMSISEYCSFVDVSADEKRRLVGMIRTSSISGYYLDIFRSDQMDNDYLFHVVGNDAVLKEENGEELSLTSGDLGSEYDKGYTFFKNQRRIAHDDDFISSWSIDQVSPPLAVDMWMMGQSNRELFLVDAPPTTLRTDLTPGGVSKSPQFTPTVVVRQNDNNAERNPFVSVYEAYNDGEKEIDAIETLKTEDNFVSLSVKTKSGLNQIICNAVDDQEYSPIEGVVFKGIYGVLSTKDNKLDYLYLGRGKSLSKGKYGLEAVEDQVSAELRWEEGQLYYSADGPVIIRSGKKKGKEYPAGRNLLVR